MTFTHLLRNTRRDGCNHHIITSCRRERHAVDAKYATKRNPDTPVLGVAASWNSESHHMDGLLSGWPFLMASVAVALWCVTSSTKVGSQNYEKFIDNDDRKFNEETICGSERAETQDVNADERSKSLSEGLYPLVSTLNWVS